MKYTTIMKIKNIRKSIKQWIWDRPTKFLGRNIKIIIYIVLFLLGLSFMSVSFWLPDEWNNAINVCCGIGSGIFTSIMVTVIVNAENSAREKKRRQKEKEFLFNDIIYSSLDVYEDVIYRINEYITLSQIEMDEIYGLYSEFKPFNEFANHLKSLKIEELSEEKKKFLNKLFNFRNYRIDYLISHLRHLPRQQYYLSGLLTEEEYRGLVNDAANDSYMSYAEHIEEFWDDEVLDLQKCVQFLRMTIYITSKTIASFDYAVKKAKKIDDDMKKEISQLYFDEIYSQSEEYVMSQMENEKAKWEYYAEHPDELEELEKQFDRTEEDFLLDELSGSICGFSEYDVPELLDKLDKDSSKVKDFFNQAYIRKAIKKKRKINSIIKAKYGKKYLEKILDSEDDKDTATDGSNS